LVRCPYFSLDRYHIGGPLDLPDPGRLSIWIISEGAAELVGAGGYRRPFRRGETVLVPASADRLTWRPRDPSQPAALLAVSLP
jgi:hypothetical protein